MADIKAIRALLKSQAVSHRRQLITPNTHLPRKPNPFERNKQPFSRERPWKTFYSSSARALGQKQRRLWTNLEHQKMKLAQNADALNEVRQSVNITTGPFS